MAEMKILQARIAGQASPRCFGKAVTMVRESFHAASGKFSRSFRKVFTLRRESFPGEV